MIKVSIVGGTGYTAGELLRILLHHPKVEFDSIISTSSAGKPIAEIHSDLLGETDLIFKETYDNPDVIFLCLGHGLSRNFLENNQLPKGCKIIDLGNDFRNEPYFNEKRFVFGLCELNREEIRSSNYVANPGCFATSIMLALLPLAAKDLLKEIYMYMHTDPRVRAAGNNPFSYRDNNLSIYKLFTHQHLTEISHTLEAAGSSKLPRINFVPMRGDFTRGIFASIYTKWHGDMSQEEVIEFYKDYYAQSPFVFVSDQKISLKEVVNTNKGLLHIEFHNGYIHISPLIDNLIKASSDRQFRI